MKKNNNPLIFAIIVLEAIYLAELIGLSIDDARPYFIPYIPVLYVVTFIATFYFHKGWNLNFIIFLVLSLIGTFLIQLANVKTGIVYGQIKYGSILGPKLFGVPFLGTLNRFVLLYCVGLLVKRLQLPNNIIKSLVGALVVILINLIGEPVATSLKFRAWTEHMNPLQNYGIRFIVAWGFLYVFNSIHFNKKNSIYLVVLVTEIVYLIYLNIMVVI